MNYTLIIIRVLEEYKTTPGHWPFSVHFSKMADQNVKQGTLKYYANGQLNSYKHDKMAD